MPDSQQLKSLTDRLVPLDHPLGQRINVRGGGGKTTLAQAISTKNSLSFIELDAIYWLPDWVERDPVDFCPKTQEAIDAAPDGWVVDGNYTGHLEDLVLKQADTVIWLDLPWRVMFWRVLTRSIMRAIDRRTICGSNTEYWRAFFSRDSLWWYYLRNRRRLINRGERFIPMVPGDIPIIRIGSARQLNEFYRIHRLTR